MDSFRSGNPGLSLFGMVQPLFSQEEVMIVRVFCLYVCVSVNVLLWASAASLPGQNYECEYVLFVCVSVSLLFWASAASPRRKLLV